MATVITFILLVQKLGKVIKYLRSNTKLHIENQVLLTPVYGVFIRPHFFLRRVSIKFKLKYPGYMSSTNYNWKHKIKKYYLNRFKLTQKSNSLTIFQFRKTVHLFDKLEKEKMPTNSK